MQHGDLHLDIAGWQQTAIITELIYKQSQCKNWYFAAFLFKMRE